MSSWQHGNGQKVPNRAKEIHMNKTITAIEAEARKLTPTARLELVRHPGQPG